MNWLKADLHVHTVLSPCANLEMSPLKIVEKATKEGIKILGITDHNATLHCLAVEKLALQEGILVLKGAEVTTREEIHCLTFFETNETLAEFQHYLDTHLIKIRNNPEFFGPQLLVDEDERILGEKEWLLISAIDQSLEQVEHKVHELCGLFIPAHISKSFNSLISQLGFIPDSLQADAFEIGREISEDMARPLLMAHQAAALISNSDAHCLEDLGKSRTRFLIDHLDFHEIRMALAGEQNRKTMIA